MADTFDWNQYFKAFDDTRSAEKAQREEQDRQARGQINSLVGNVERDALRNAEKGKNAKRADLDVSNYGSFKNARTAFEQNQGQNPQVAKTGWEANLNLGRQQGEVDPWNTLANRLVGVQQTTNRVNQQTRQKQQSDALKQAQSDFDRRSREIMANDTSRKGTAAEQNAAFAAAVAKYGDIANQQAKNGVKLVMEPYAQAMQDCRDGKGPCPPDMNQFTSVASSMDPNNLSASGQVALTKAQEDLRKRLDAIREDEGFSYGSGSDETSWF